MPLLPSRLCRCVCMNTQRHEWWTMLLAACAAVLCGVDVALVTTSFSLITRCRFPWKGARICLQVPPRCILAGHQVQCACPPHSVRGAGRAVQAGPRRCSCEQQQQRQQQQRRQARRQDACGGLKQHRRACSTVLSHRDAVAAAARGAVLSHRTAVAAAACGAVLGYSTAVAAAACGAVVGYRLAVAATACGAATAARGSSCAAGPTAPNQE
jgi:hypothetical protein